MIPDVLVGEASDSGTGVSLGILRYFQEHLFYRTPLDECFYLEQSETRNR